MTGVSVGWRERVVVAAAAALVGPVAYFRMAMAGQAPVGFDLVTYFYPYRNYLATAWAHHRWLPLWNSDIYFGAPFLANIQAAALYPLSVIFAFFPTERALGFAILLNLAIAGLGMCLYGLKSERLGAIGAVTAAIVFVLSGQMNAQMGHLNQGGTLCWAPWLMLAVDRLVVRPRPGKVAITAVLVALVILAGHTQQAYFTILFGAIAGAGRLWPLLLRQQWVRVVKRMAVGALALALGFGMAAAQLLPTLELVSLSFRHGGLSLQDAGSFSIPLKGFAGWLFPDYQNQQGAEFSAYVGMAALALGALAVVTRWRKPRIAFLAALAVAGVWLALGPHGHLYSIAFRLLPGLNLFRVPARLVIFSTVALALLAGHGAKIARQGTIAWSRRPLRPILARLLWASATMAEAPVVLLIVDHLAGYPQRSLLKALPVPVSWADLLGLATFSAATVALVAAGWMGSHRRIGRRLMWALPVLVAIELTVAGQNTEMQRPLPASLYHQQDSTLAALPASLNVRYLSLIHPNTNDDLGEQAPSGLPAAEVDRYLQMADQVRALRPDVSMGTGRLTADGYDGGILPLGSYVVWRQGMFPPDAGMDPPDFTVYISTNQMPPTQWLVDSGVSEVLALAGQPMGNGLTSQPLTDSITAWSPPGPTPGRAYLISGTDRIPANVTSDSGEQLTVQIPGRASGNLILTDTYYPGWSATVDGRPVSISRYEGFFRSVSVPVGAKQVVFSYESKPLELGLAISVMSLILGFGLGLYPSVWRRIKGRVARASAVSG